ncbi:hypothetical protein IRJ34_15265 [Paenarthrobacter sp. GOM3]|uniref:hypothetical protein n=1 Tax=Paenarthrobacter sp. GOM3 TaxID=2782567 RepID=UPI001BA779FA|nr:hypothetical protein [Paenarthrobacter sp. GOM3]WOH17694.1 hypothetical protein IRJ34_15265 [Paenarthrobacter sp. GOM3]
MSPKKEALTAEEVRAEILAPVIEEQARIDDGEREAREAIAEAAAAREVELSAWRDEAAECQRLFRAEPQRPEPLDVRRFEAVLHRAVTARTAAWNWQQKLLAEHRGKAETAYRAALPDLLERTRATALGSTDAVVAEWNSWLRLVKDCRSAEELTAGRRQHNPPSGRMLEAITPADLLEAVNGTDLLKPAPVETDWIKGEPHDGFLKPKTSWPDGSDGPTLAEARERSRPGGARWWL